MFRPFLTSRKFSNHSSSNWKPGIKPTRSTCPSCTKDWWPKKSQIRRELKWSWGSNTPPTLRLLEILLLAKCFQVLCSELTPGSLLAPECSSKKQLVRDALKDPDKWQLSTLEKQLSRPGKAIRAIHVLQPLHKQPAQGMATCRMWIIQRTEFRCTCGTAAEPEQVPTCHQFCAINSSTCPQWHRQCCKSQQSSAPHGWAQGHCSPSM